MNKKMFKKNLNKSNKNHQNQMKKKLFNLSNRYKIIKNNKFNNKQTIIV